jgi:hypothetical protein
MKLKHVVAGAAVISLPLWAFALTRGQEANWTWVMATGDQVCSSDDENPMSSGCYYGGGWTQTPNPDRTVNLFADFDLDGDADWIILDLTANEDPNGGSVETYDLTLRLVSGNGTGTWDVGQAEVVYTAECRQDLERVMDEPDFYEYWVFDPNMIYLLFPNTMDPDRGDHPIFHVQDVNGDTYPDLILEGLTYTITEGDDDGTGGTTQLIDRYNAMYTFLNTGGTGFRCAGDVDGDGQTRVGDLVGLLEDWGCDDSAQ